MNTQTENLVSANQLVFGDEFRPHNDKRYRNTWMRVLDARTDARTVGSVTTITYEIPDSGMKPMTTHYAALAAMEVR